MLETFENYLKFYYDGSFAELSRLTGVSINYLYRLRKGFIHPDKVPYGYYLRLSGVLGLDFDSLWLTIEYSYDANNHNVEIKEASK